MTRASSRLGTARITSIMPHDNAVDHPRGKSRQTRPSRIPVESESVTTMQPMISEKRAPCMIRDSMSRPVASVPSTNCQEPPSSQTGGSSR